MRKITKTLGMPIWRLTGDMAVNSYTEQEIADYLGIDPLCISHIREISGFQSDGSYEPLIDYSRELSALLITLDQQQLLAPISKLIRISWQSTAPSDNPREAAHAFERATELASIARFEASNSLDVMLREWFPVPDREKYFTAAALQDERKRQHEREKELSEQIAKNTGDWNNLSTTAIAFGKRLSNIADQFEDAKQRISNDRTDKQ